MKYSILIIATLLGCLATSSAVAESPIKPGDHVAIVGNTFADQLRIHGYLETKLLNCWPDDPVSVRNLGWGGDMLSARDRPTGFPTEESTLTKHQTDVIIACFGMGESFGGEEGLSDFRDQLQSFIQSHTGKKYNGQSNVRLVLVSPIAYEHLGDLTPRQEQRDQDLAMYAKAMGDVGMINRIPFVDLYQPSREWMNEHQSARLTTNGIHLNPLGYWAVSHVLFRELTSDDSDSQRRRWSVRIDASAFDTKDNANANVVGATGLEVSDLTLSRVNGITSAMTFQANELVAPNLPPPDLPSPNLPSPDDSTLSPHLNQFRDTLKVANLPPGTFQLFIDEVAIVTANSQQWEQGVAIDRSPAHQAVETLRQAINDKNLQFTYSWKALNQVHIVGERKQSASGRALPSEVLEFKRIADQRDAQLRDQVKLTQRTWRLTRIDE